ncbi:hypothetical protein [Sphingobacterium faecale]|uniref:Uncharacterized protein n=1 Tax=Sphingobacterium faecale TaxID=2803775 RepID=A0ABS1R225_9SPHI|nr:hypothetical protein [Sphingobacterium faecale]MBL1408693.1 hypothetical protein [Sphingobacterium faecale]
MKHACLVKHLFLILLTALWSSACRSNKESNFLQQQVETSSHNQASLQWHRSDSTMRYWYYQSDSPFYYHPEVGLFGTSGRLAVGEKQLKHQAGKIQQDSSHYLIVEQSAGSKKSIPKDRSSGWIYVIGIGIFLVIGLGSYLKKHL